MNLNPWLFTSATLPPIATLTLLVLVLDKDQAVLSTKHQPTLVSAGHETRTEPIWSRWQGDHRHALSLSAKLWQIHQIYCQSIIVEHFNTEQGV